ncbi:MAG: MobF family relaxase [Ferrimicrobium sp.]
MAKLRGGSFSYYAKRELADEGIAAPIRILGRGWEALGLAPPRSIEELEDRFHFSDHRTPIRAFDVVVAAPKSVSVAYATGSRELREQIVESHDRSVDRVMALMEALDLSRLDRSGRVLPGAGFVAVGVGHRLSRRGDPHLHTHVVVANRTTYNGSLGAVDHATLRRHLGVYELAYRSELRVELQQRCGVELEGVGMEPWVLRSQDRALVEAFSERRREVVDHSERFGGSSKARQIATLATRPPKIAILEAAIEEGWRTRLNTVGDSVGGVVEVAQLRPCGDPLLTEFAETLEHGRLSIDEALRETFDRTLGTTASAEIARTGSLVIDDVSLALDGSFLRDYRQLSWQRRLALAGGRSDEIERIRSVGVDAQRSISSVVQGLETSGLGGGARARVLARSRAEESLILSSAQLRTQGGSWEPLVVVDVNSVAPSQLLYEMRSHRTTVRVLEDGPVDVGTHDQAVLRVPGRSGGALMVAESANTTWESFLERATCVVEGGMVERLVVDTPGQCRRLRSALSRRVEPSLIAGVAGGLVVFHGERVESDTGVVGRVEGVDGWDVTFRDGTDDLHREPLRGVHFASISCVERLGRDAERVIQFGASRLPHGASRDEVYIAVPGIGALTEQARRVARSADGRAITLDSRIVTSLRRDRWAAFSSAGSARVRGEVATEFYRVRHVTDALAAVYDRARRLGLDERSGRERIVDDLRSRNRELDTDAELKRRPIVGREMTTSASSRVLRDEGARVW